LSRRLGDDPLARARSERAKTGQTTAPAASDGAGQTTTVTETNSPARASYNDVFFQRRQAGAPVQPVAGSNPDAPEITEISEIPEIREATANEASHREAHLSPTAEPEVAAVQLSTIEDVVTSPTVSPLTAAAERPAEVPVTSTGASTPEPQDSGGFFKRLFGKFK
jgi:hypothetical protein